MRQLDRGNILLKWVILVLDFAIFNLVLFLVNRYIFRPMGHVGIEFSRIVYLANGAFILSTYLFPTLVHKISSSPVDVIIRTTKRIVSTWFFLFVLLLVARYGEHAFTDSLIYGVIILCIMLVVRWIEHSLIHSRERLASGIKSLIVGDVETISKVVETLKRGTVSRFNIVGYYSDGEASGTPEWLHRLGTMNDFFDKVQKESDPSAYDAIFCTLSWTEPEKIESVLSFCDNSATRFYLVPPDPERENFNLKPELLGDTFVYTNHEYPLDSLRNQYIKRAFDIVVSGIVCICLLPFLPIIAVITKIQSPGPLFFKQARTGMDGKTFQCIKFRSMHVNKDADTLQATENDPRKFPWGNFMRKSNIDELPQFFNVLKGDMSIVGPRPHMLKHTEEYGKLINRYMVRHFVRPGITGWAQVTGYRGETKELWQMEERVKRDYWYIKHWTFGLDLRIILMTFLQFFKHDEHAY